MVVLSVILGIIFMVLGLACMLTPLSTFVDLGYFIALLLLIYGVATSVMSAVRKDFGPQFLLGLLAAMFGFIIMVVPGLVVFANGVIIYLIAAWFLVQGVTTVYLALTNRTKRGRKLRRGWMVGFVIGLLEIVVSIFSFAHPTMLMVAGGVLIGIYFLMIGASFLAAPFETDMLIAEGEIVEKTGEKKSKK